MASICFSELGLIDHNRDVIWLRAFGRIAPRRSQHRRAVALTSDPPSAAQQNFPGKRSRVADIIPVNLMGFLH